MMLDEAMTLESLASLQSQINQLDTSVALLKEQMVTLSAAVAALQDVNDHLVSVTADVQQQTQKIQASLEASKT
jgi:archaellum component FlaC